MLRLLNRFALLLDNTAKVKVVRMISKSKYAKAGVKIGGCLVCSEVRYHGTVEPNAVRITGPKDCSVSIT